MAVIVAVLPATNGGQETGGLSVYVAGADATGPHELIEDLELSLWMGEM